MKIIYATDIHGSFNRVADLLFETTADVYIIAGDLIDIPFYSIESAIAYHEMQNNFMGLKRKMEMEDMELEDFVDNIMDIPETPDDILENAYTYQQYTIRARRVMQQKYKVLENILAFKSSANVFTLPGNYDMDLKFTALHESDLHLHWHNINNTKIAGYGGADVWTAGIPQRYIVRYQGGTNYKDKKNEMYTFFKAIRPNIIVSLQPAHGIHDRLSFKGPSGSPALRTYCDNNNVQLCLTGHIHNDWGMTYSDNTVYLNPSNFGEVTTASGEVSEGGFFYQIEMDDNRIEHITFKKIVDYRIHDIIDYTTKDNTWHEHIIDAERLNALKQQKNYDDKSLKYSHIPEIELFNEIKQLFRMFQTNETEDRINTMEDLTKMMKGKFDDIAMDIVGSVNLGISQKSSDIDIVLYLRCGKECTEMPEQCITMLNAKKMIADLLQDKYKFEIIDCIDLNEVEQSIIEKDYECETTQRFVTYRSICRPINYKVIAPVEDLLNKNIEFRKEMEGSIRSYFKIFVTTTQHTRSFDKYMIRLKTIGIKLPSYIRKKIRVYLQQEDVEN
jgi:Icc-related predicted phosphoesterase